MSLTTELEQLQNRKEALRNKLQFVQAKISNLVDRQRILEEKLAIQELDEKIMVKTVLAEQLESKIRELEKRLKEPQRKPEVSPETRAITPQVVQEVREPQKKEPMNVMVKVAPDNTQQPKQS